MVVGSSLPSSTFKKKLSELEPRMTNDTRVVLYHNFLLINSLSEGRIRAAMYMPCVKCSCSELKLEKHLHTVFVLTKN